MNTREQVTTVPDRWMAPSPTDVLVYGKPSVILLSFPYVQQT